MKPWYCIIMLIVLACSGPEDLSESRFFTYNQPNQITSLDPAFARSMTNIWAVHHLYSKLVRMDTIMRVIPDLCKSWDMSQDGLEYTFYLKTNVSFHDDPLWRGQKRRLTADDVVYSFERLMDPQLYSPGSWIFKDKVADDRAFRALDDSTFVLSLKQPFAPILSLLTIEYCGIVAREAVEFYKGDFRSHPVGTGPFQLTKWYENEAMFLAKNPSYPEWNENLPYLDGIRINFIPDRKSALLEMVNGNIDYMSGFDPSYQALLLEEDGTLQKQYQDQLTIQSAAFLNTEYIGVNLEMARKEKSVLANPDFRKALNFAIDKSKLISTLNGGIGYPANNGFIPKGLPGYAPSGPGFSFNSDSSEYYLEKSNYDGEVLIIDTNKDYLDKCLFIANSWENIGVNAQVNLLESSILRDRMRKGESLLFRASWIADYPDAENFLSVFYGGNPAPPNYTRYASYEFDSLYQQAITAEGQQEIVGLYTKANNILISDAPVIFVYYDETFQVINRQIRGLKVNSQNLLEAEYIR